MTDPTGTAGDGRKGVLTDPELDFPRWYQDVVARAELAESGPVRGSMVIRPWGYAIWERLQAELDRRIKEAGAENAYFPLFIPESFLSREAEHVEGFDPELAVVTHAGGKALEEPVVVRPTSETVINHFFSKWVQSHRDLPLLINQWANVVRWELRPRLFLRTTEFLWQEGHTAHATQDDAMQYALRIIRDVYEATMSDVASIPVLVGHKTERERFAGAIRTWTCEGMMGDGKALQLGTSHELGQNFAKAFDIVFSDETGAQRHVWQTSWGVTTRLIGALVMAHGDAFGLRLPPALAPVEVIVLVVRAGEGVQRAAEALAEDLTRSGRRVRIDDRTAVPFGRRVVDWELKGVPVRIEVGPRDVAEGNAAIAFRHARKKEQVALTGAVERARSALASAGEDLRNEARAFRDSRIFDVATAAEAVEASGSGLARLPWSIVEADNGEDALAARGVSVRCLQAADGSVATEGRETLSAIVGRAY